MPNLLFIIHNQQCTYKSQMLHVLIHQKLLFYSLFFLNLPPNWYQFKKWHLQINIRLFWTRKKWKSLINVKNLHTYIKYILNHVWNHILSLFSELFRENCKKCLPAIRKRNLISEFIFNSLQLVKRFSTIFWRWEQIWNTFRD